MLQSSKNWHIGEIRREPLAPCRRFRRLQRAEVEPHQTNMNPAIKVFEVSKPNRGGYRDVGKAEQRSIDWEPAIRRPEADRSKPPCFDYSSR